MDIGVFSSSWPAIAASLALAFGFSNGFRDSSTIVASVVSTRALNLPVAFGLCAVFEFLGASFLGRRVAGTIAQAVVGAGTYSPVEVARVLSCALAAAFLWGLISWWRAWPTSNSQALIGGLAGASFAAWGSERFVDPRKLTVFAILVVTPLLGFLISAVVTLLLRQLGAWMTSAAKPIAQSLHVLGCLTVSAAHGSNDGQLILGLLAVVAAASAGHTNPEPSPLLYRLTVASVIAGGVLLGGQRLVRKLGMKFYRIRDMQGLGAQSAAALTLIGCLSSGFPASTTQLVAGSIVGAGVAKNVRSVRWQIVREIVLSWLVTVPASAVLSATLQLILIGRKP